MSSSHQIDLPRKIVVGYGVMGEIGRHLRSMYPKNSKVLIVTGPHVKEIVAGLVEESLGEAGFSVEVSVVAEALASTASQVADEAVRSGADIIIGLGGGKSIDVAKFAAKVAGKSFVSVPTAASHDGISSPFASLKGLNGPISRPAVPPEAILIDLSVVSSAPRRHNVAGFGDLIGKITAGKDWKLASLLKGEYYGDYAASLARLSAVHVSAYYKDIALGTPLGYRVLLEALVSSGVAMCIAGSTRPASGSEHLFAHALHMVAKNPPLHGEAVGVGTIMMAKLHRLNWRKIRRLLKAVGAPVTARDLGVSDDEVVEALRIAPTIRPDRYTILGDKPLDEGVARRLAEITGVIER